MGSSVLNSQSKNTGVGGHALLPGESTPGQGIWLTPLLRLLLWQAGSSPLVLQALQVTTNQNKSSLQHVNEVQISSGSPPLHPQPLFCPLVPLWRIRDFPVHTSNEYRALHLSGLITPETECAHQPGLGTCLRPLVVEDQD